MRAAIEMYNHLTGEIDALPIAAAGVCLNHKGMWLGYKRSENYDSPGYDFPGGGVEAGETCWEAAVRELWEECVTTENKKVFTLEMLNEGINWRVQLPIVMHEPQDGVLFAVYGIEISDECAKYIATSSDPADYQGASTPYEGVPVWFSDFDEYQGKYSEYNEAFRRLIEYPCASTLQDCIENSHPTMFYTFQPVQDTGHYWWEMAPKYQVVMADI